MNKLAAKLKSKIESLFRTANSFRDFNHCMDKISAQHHISIVFHSEHTGNLPPSIKDCLWLKIVLCKKRFGALNQQTITLRR